MTATAPIAIRTSPSSRCPLSAQPSPTRPTAAPAAPSTVRISCIERYRLSVQYRWRRGGGIGLDHHGGAVGADLAHGGPQLAAVEQPADPRIGAHQGRVLH